LLGITVLALFAGLVRLGFWQIARAHEKERILAAFEQRRHQPPVRLVTGSRPGPALQYHPVVVKGRYDGVHQFLLDNRVRHQRPGFEVLTPLRLRGGGAVLVDRGWVPQGARRTQLPSLPVPDGEQRVHGLIRLPGRGFVLGEGEARQPGWPKVVQRVAFGLESRQLGYPLVPALVLMDRGEAGGFERGWQPVTPGFGPARHYAYAFQWFALAAVFAFLLLRLAFRAWWWRDRQRTLVQGGHG